MRKSLATLILLCFATPAWAVDFIFTVSNPNMIQTQLNAGEVSVGPIDPFNPSAHCTSFVSPNSCSVVGNYVEWTLVFDYSLTMNVPGTIDVIFIENNGINGTQGMFTVESSPSPLVGLSNGMTGNFTYMLKFPYFSQDIIYGMTVDLDVTYNP
jgi:hypothetical protein